MIMRTTTIAAFAALSLGLGACEGMDTGQTIGTLGGAAGGGLLGSQIGGGSGQLAATAAGTLIGALAGGKLGGFSAYGGTTTKQKLLALEGVRFDGGAPRLPGL